MVRNIKVSAATALLAGGIDMDAYNAVQKMLSDGSENDPVVSDRPKKPQPKSPLVADTVEQKKRRIKKRKRR